MHPSVTGRKSPALDEEDLVAFDEGGEDSDSSSSSGTASPRNAEEEEEALEEEEEDGDLGPEIPADLLGGWEEWLREPWYGDIVYYLFTGEIRGADTQLERRNLRRRALRFILVHQERRRLCYREKSGQLAQCCKVGEVPDVLHALHGVHAHYADEITKKLAVGRLYWPTRAKDISKYCRSCLSCQKLGPLRPSRGLLPIIQVQPLDVLGIDYIGPIRPVPQSGAKYIVIAVDYFTRYLFARAVPTATSANSLEFFKREVVHVFGWPRAIYSDNGSHFTGGIFPETLREMKVKQFFAPVRHPASVGLAERYVQVVLAGLRRALQVAPAAILQWDTFLTEVVHAANSRAIRLQGYTPVQLMFGFTPRYADIPMTPDEEIRRDILEEEVAAVGIPAEEREARNYHARLANLDELRELAMGRKIREAKKTQEKSTKTRESPKEGDLVLLKRLALSNQRGRKLEPRWEGPYKLVRLSHHGQSGHLESLHEQATVGRYHLNDLKVFVPWEENERPEGEGWRTMAQAALEEQANIDSRVEEDERRETRNQMGEGNNDIPEEEWWMDFVAYPDEGCDEQAPEYWREREVNLRREGGLSDFAQGEGQWPVPH
jgi:transposase InsO family protein